MKVLLLIITAITATAQEITVWPQGDGVSCKYKYEVDKYGNVLLTGCGGREYVITTPIISSPDSYKVCWYIPSETNVVNCSPVFDFNKALAVKALIEKSWIQEVK